MSNRKMEHLPDTLVKILTDLENYLKSDENQNSATPLVGATVDGHHRDGMPYATQTTLVLGGVAENRFRFACDDADARGDGDGALAGVNWDWDDGNVAIWDEQAAKLSACYSTAVDLVNQRRLEHQVAKLREVERALENAKKDAEESSC